MEARVLAVCVGLIERVPYRGRQMRTGIFKRPVEGRVHAGRLGLAGDHQADPRYHGGPPKAVYAYPSEHYPFWRAVYPDLLFDHGGFGENLTTVGWMEDAVREGDVYRVGSAILQVTEPRTPCIKLGVKFGRTGMVAKFRASRRTGFYLAVREEGVVEAGDAITLMDRDPAARTVISMAVSP